jgi:3-phenylpropionate/trans-cinnamate dioxygenase ferredoxin reductase subunit
VLRGEQELPVLHRLPSSRFELADWRLGESARHLDTAARQVTTTAGTLDFDVLVIATGARARRIPGLPGRVLRTWDDARALRAQLRPHGTLAIIGAGLIGCEVAASASVLGMHVHLIDALDGPMTRVVGSALAAEVAALHRSHGVSLHLSTTATAGPSGELALADGTMLSPDLVVQAVGASPDTSWLTSSGLDVTDGVQCDATGRVSYSPAIFAVGDVANWAGIRSEHWTRAVEQADAVAAAITGQSPRPADVAYWWSDQYDVKFQAVGLIKGSDDVRILSWGAPKRRILALFGAGGELVGGVGLSAAKAITSLRRLLVSGAMLEEVTKEYEIELQTVDR